MLEEIAIALAGMTPAEARVAARRAFGGVEQARARSARRAVVCVAGGLSSATCSYAARTLAGAPGFTGVAVLRSPSASDRHHHLQRDPQRTARSAAVSATPIASSMSWSRIWRPGARAAVIRPTNSSTISRGPALRGRHRGGGRRHAVVRARTHRAPARRLGDAELLRLHGTAAADRPGPPGPKTVVLTRRRSRC